MNNIDWLSIRVDGLFPGLETAKALQIPGWELKDGLLFSHDSSSLNIGAPYSCASCENDRVIAITGKVLREKGSVLISAGDSWFDALGKLPFQNSMLDNEEFDLTLMLLPCGNFVGGIYFANASWSNRPD